MSGFCFRVLSLFLKIMLKGFFKGPITISLIEDGTEIPGI